MDAEQALRVIDGTVANDLEPRTIRAIDECMTVLEGEQPHSYEVFSQSGRRYEVNGVAETCSCPDHQHRECTCKHLRRVRLETDSDHERWEVLTSTIGTAILGIDEELNQLEDRIAELEAAQRAMGRLVQRIDELRPDRQRAINGEAIDAPVAVPRADD